MRKSIITAALLACSTAIAGAASADAGTVDVELKIDLTDPAAIIYKHVLDKAELTCDVDTHCKAALVDAFVEAIADEKLMELHHTTVSADESTEAPKVQLVAAE